jgi:FlaA1/EpsC-like NDP-sugar epimerase
MLNKLIKKYLKHTAKTRTLFFITNDLISIPTAIALSFFLRFEGQIPVQYYDMIGLVIFLALVFSIPIFYFHRLYSFSWSYVSAEELLSLIKASIISFSFLGATFFIFRDNPVFLGFPRSTLFMSFFLVVLFCGGTRLSKRLYLQLLKNKIKEKGKKKKTLIVGAGDSGEQILRSILSSESSDFYPVGIIDDSSVKQGISIHGFKILGRVNDIPKVVKEKKVESIVIAMPSAGSAAIKKAVEKGREAGAREIKIIPPLTEIIGGEISVANLKDVKIEDLLERDLVSLDFSSIERFIENKKILITGAAGSIGSEISRQVARFNPSSLVLLDQDETGIFNILEELSHRFSNLNIHSEIADIREQEKVDYIFREFKPQIVFHAAAYKHVPLMEDHFDEAVKNNIFGTENVAEASLRYGAEKFVFISTDKAVRPISIMGATKRVGELICRNLNEKNSTKFISVRFGNVLDSRGSVIPIFREQIRKGGPVEVTHPEMKRYFMMIPEACLLVLQAAEMGEGGEVFVLDMGEPIKILDLAREMIKLSGFEPDKDIPIVFSEPRPGEKLFEEILTAEEGVNATKQKNIFTARTSLEIKEEFLKNVLDKIRESVGERDKNKLNDNLKEIMPSFSPLDNK